MAERKLLAALGTPCGGTTYVTNCLKASGVRVSKETMGTDGIVCGFFVWGLKDSPDDYVFDHTIRYIRHPLRSAETLVPYARKEPEHPWHHSDPGLRALRYWVLTHEKIPTDAPTLRIGPWFRNDWNALSEILPFLKQPLEPQDRVTNHKVTQRYAHLIPTWSEWKQQDPDFANRALELVRKYELE